MLDTIPNSSIRKGLARFGLFDILRIMVRVCAKGIVMFSLLLTFLLQFSTLVRGAVDIYIWDKPHCDGIAQFCLKMDPNKCCGYPGGNFPFPSTSFGNHIKCMKTQGYVNGQCKTYKIGARGYGGCLDCTSWNGCSGVEYYSRCGTQSDGLSSETETKNGTSECTTPSGIAYHEEGMEGLWRMESSNTTEQMELKNLPQEEKVNWLKSHGATYIDFENRT